MIKQDNMSKDKYAKRNTRQQCIQGSDKLQKVCIYDPSEVLFHDQVSELYFYTL